MAVNKRQPTMRGTARASEKAARKEGEFFGESTLWNHINALLPKSREVY